MNIGRVSIPVLLSILIVMFMAVIGCGKKDATSVISGAVNGDIIEGVTINMTGNQAKSTTTDASGNFIFNNQDNGYFTITPYLDGYSFNPANADVVVSGVSVTGIDFTSTWAGYSISGVVTGDVQKGVTLTLNKVGSTSILTSATTDSDGKYTLINTEIINNISFDVTPSLPGYKFTPSTREVDIGTASVTGEDFVSIATHASGTAKGTYTWDSAGNLAITWTEGTFPCNWPKLGTETESEVIISNTIMTWPDAIQWPGMMLWTRTTSSTGNDPAGVWTATDQSGNTYTATITATDSTHGSISLEATIIACAYAWSTTDYKVSLSYQDPAKAATSVSVTGSGISGSPLFTYNDTAHEWNTDDIDISSSPTPPFTYTFTITDSGDITWEETSCFVDWPTDLHYIWTPVTSKNSTLTFLWDKISDAGASYVVQLRDSSYKKLIWESSAVTTCSTVTGCSTTEPCCSVDYDGTNDITNGTKNFDVGSTYYYYVIVKSTSACSNGHSFAEGSFTYSGP